MKKFRYLLAVSMVLTLAFSLVGCGKDTDAKSDEPAAEDTTSDKTMEEMFAEPNLGETTLGGFASAGSWSLSVAKVETGDAFGSYTADDGGTLMKLTVVLINESGANIEVKPSDFTVSNADSSASALSGDQEYPASALVNPGKMHYIEPVFYVPNSMVPEDLTFVFQNIESGITKIKSTLK